MKRLLIVMLCCVLLLLSGCNKKYKRISFESDALNDSSATYIQENTVVVNKATECFADKLPIYRIQERNISNEEAQQMLHNLGIAQTDLYEYKLEGNSLTISLAAITDFSRGYFDMTEEELEKAAWEAFRKIPFLEGEYKYIGMTNSVTVSDAVGTHITRGGARFNRVLDGVRVTKGENYILEFDGSGLVEIRIKLYDYEKIGMMDLVPMEDAEARIKTPDGFTWETTGGVLTQNVNTLQVDKIELQLVNQHYRGCEILQPIYRFIGTANLQDNTWTEFASKVIAIPESYTYEATAVKAE